MPIVEDVQLGRNTKIFHPGLVDLYGCTIGKETTIGPFVEIQHGGRIGARCKISSYTFICQGVTVEDEVFVGHGVMFNNDIYPQATTGAGHLQTAVEWTLAETRIKPRASIGSNATILGDVTIGENAMGDTGAVFTHDVPDRAIRVTPSSKRTLMRG